MGQFCALTLVMVTHSHTCSTITQNGVCTCTHSAGLTGVSEYSQSVECINVGDLV